MAPTPASIPRAVFVNYAKRAVLATGPEIAKLSAQNIVLRRGLSVNHTQGITLGIIVLYVVVIALLWNIPYLRYSLWPFKVHLPTTIPT
jgi:membrane protein YdbS with pleckstrin-like domain